MKPNIFNDDYFSVEEASLNDIFHYGRGHLDGGHSGRYPWGSGDDKFQRPTDFYSYVRNLETKGLSRVEISQGLGMSTTQLKAYYSVARAMRRREMVESAKSLSEKKTDREGNPMTNERIGIILGERYNDDHSPIGESTVRSLLDTDREANMNAAMNTANILMKAVDEKGMIDVGTMVDKELGVTTEKLNQALVIAEAQGYVVLHGSVEQVAHPGQRINYRLLAPKDTPKSAAYDYANIHTVTDYYSEDNGKSFRPAFVYPKSINPDRVMVRYKEEGGLERDGTIEIRRGVKDLSLGSSQYAQVRILVDNGGGNKDRYLKGMAIYSDGSDMPDGVDVIFNTNKPLGTDKMDVFKKTKDNLEKDPKNPFGSAIKERGGQSYYDDPNGEFVDPITGNKQSLSLINKRAEAGDWNEWSKEIPSQMLSKQPKATIGRQLHLSLVEKQNEFDEIMDVNNPTVKAKLLEDFANDCDKAAVDLKATSFPDTRYHVILPITSLKDNEIYAPNYPDGTQLALIRFPHGGLFEIPIVTVNNRNPEAMKKIGPDARDAVGINSTVASQLSGADFDGDTVLTIPTNTKGVNIKNAKPLDGLKNFDTGTYGPDPDGIKVDADGTKHYFRNGIEYKHMSEQYKQLQMGVVSNLISDMTLQGAPDDEVERAVKHSMVVIDAVKHDLDYTSSALDNNISELHAKYQGKPQGGASTIVSRSKSPLNIPKRAEGAFILDQEGNKDNGNVLTLIDPEKKIFKDEKTGKIYSEKDKKTVYIDPKTGEKLYHDTREAYYKVQYTDPNNPKKTLSAPAYIKDANGKYKRPRYILEDEQKNELYFPNEEGVFEKVNLEKHILKEVPQTQEVSKMYYTNDAKKLSSGTIQEEYYAEYANKLKEMGNKARLEYQKSNDNPIPYSAKAKAEYAEEVKSLEHKVSTAELNAPRERAANILATSIVKARMEAAETELSDEEIKKLKQTELTSARAKYNAHNARFDITEREWEAIQKGAFSKNRLQQILRYADQDVVRKLATPKSDIKLSDADIRRIKALSSGGETNSAIAARLHVSLSTVIKYLGEERN